MVKKADITKIKEIQAKIEEEKKGLRIAEARRSERERVMKKKEELKKIRRKVLKASRKPSKIRVIVKAAKKVGAKTAKVGVASVKQASKSITIKRSKDASPIVGGGIGILGTTGFSEPIRSSRSRRKKRLKQKTRRELQKRFDVASGGFI